MQIDAEVYFWKNEKNFRNPLIRENKILQQQYLPEQIAQSLHRNGIDVCLGVAGDSAEVETRFLAELAMTHHEIAGVIGWLDLLDASASEKILEFSEYAPIRAYRLSVAKPPFPLPATMQTLKTFDYTLDLINISMVHPNVLSRWLQENPEQQFVIADGAGPDAKKTPAKEWELIVRTLAKNPNLSCKLSGLFTTGNRKSWKPADFYPFLEILFDSFGTKRILFSSDWPLMLVSGMYVQWKSLVEKFMEKFTPDDRGLVFGANAIRVYRI